MELIRNLLNLNNRNFRSVEKFRLVENRLKAHSTQEHFPPKENFVKFDYWPTQIFRRKKILKLKIFNFYI
jgi:hypothetical protein